MDENMKIENMLSSLNLMDVFLEAMTNPESVVDQLKSMKERIDPLVNGICSIVVDYREEYAENCGRMAKANATVKKKAYDAYVEAGFSEEQAMSLILNDEKIITEALKSIKVSGSRQ